MIALRRRPLCLLFLVLAGAALGISAHREPALAQTIVPAVAPSAGPLTVTATHQLGTLIVEVRGHAPPGSSLTATLTGEIARDLPVVLIARTATVADSDGTYAVRFPFGSLSFPNSALTATVSMPGAAPVRALIALTVPNPAFNSSNNTLPNDK